MDHVGRDVICMILFLIDRSADVRSIELVCKQWRDISRQRKSISSSRYSDFNLLKRYPRLLECDVYLNFPTYHESTINLKLSTMQLLCLRLANMEDTHHPFLKRLFKQVIASKCRLQMRLERLDMFTMINVQGKVMVIDGNDHIGASVISCLFANATEGRLRLITTTPDLQDIVFQIHPKRY